MAVNIANLTKKVKQYIPDEKRFAHTVAVEKECRKLAEIFSLSPEDAERLSVAALLHDITKHLNTDEQIKLCEKYNIPYDSFDTASPKVFHSRTGAAAAKDKFSDWVDDIIIEAIRCHTTGKANMSLIDKLLYLADYIEETRTFEDCVTLRKYFYEGLSGDILRHLNDTLILSFDMTIRDLLSYGASLHTDTVISRNFLIIERKEQKGSAEKRGK